MLDLSALGRLTLDHGDLALLAGRRKLLALLVYLVRHRRPVTRAALATMFWPGADESHARQSLRTALTELRGELGDALQADADRASIAPEAIALDADRFESLVAAGEFRRAEEVWGGGFLAGLEDIGDEDWRSWLEGERVALRKKRSWMLEQQVASAEQAGHWDEAAGYAERWVGEFPGDERAATRLIGSLKAAGRLAEASGRHAALAEALREANGAAPSVEFVALGALVEPPVLNRPGIRGLLTPDLIGREGAFSLLSAAWADTRRGLGRAVIVDGEEGLGKTRLLEEYGRFLRSDGSAFVLQSRAFHSEASRSGSAVRPLLDQLAAAPGLSAVPAETLGALGALSPAIRERFPAATPSGDGRDAAIIRAVTDVAYETPLALLLDDATAADPDSAAVLGQLLRRPPPGLLLVFAGRASHWAEWEGIEEIRRLAHVDSVTLAPLTQDETRRFVATVAPMSGPNHHAMADRLYRESGGRPGILQLFLGELAERGTLATDADGQWTLAVRVDELTVPVPGALTERIQARLRPLRDSGRRVIEAAAVIGPRIDPALLEVVAGVSTDQFGGATAELLARRLLRTAPAGDGGLEFAGEAERRAVYDRIVPSTRRALHRNAARALRPATGDPDRLRAAEEHRRLGGPAPRRNMIVAGIAVLVAVVGAGVYRQVAAGRALPLEAPVLLASTQNLTNDSTLGATLDLAARIGLQQSARIRVISSKQVAEAIGRMRREPMPVIVDPALAREIAVRENLAAFIVLSVAAVDTSYLITARVVEPEQEHDLFATGVTAPGHAAILTGLDEVLKRVRTGMGEARSAVRRSDQSLPRVTTSSLEALRWYTSGRVHWTRGRFVDAGRSWRQAVQLDTAFALALSSLGTFYYFEGDSGIDRRAGDLYFDRALAHADRLTERERLALLASVARWRGRPDEAVARTRTLVERFPDRDTWFDLGTTLIRLDRAREAVEPLKRAVALDSVFGNAWVNLATAYAVVGSIDSALAAYAHAARVDSVRLHVGGNVSQEWGGALLRAGREAAAESLFALATQIEAPTDRALGMRSVGFLEMYRGRYRRAIDWLDRAATVTVSAGGSRLSAARNRWLAGAAYLDLGDVAQARQQLDRAESLLGEVATDPVFLYYLGDLRLRTGDVPGARRLLRRLEAIAKPGVIADQDSRLLLQASIALVTRDAAAAIAAARQSDRRGSARFRDEILSQAFEATGRIDSALAAAQRVDTNWSFGYEAQRLWRHGSLRVARLALQAGDSATARAAVARQLERWRNADVDFPDLIEARALASRLAASGR